MLVLAETNQENFYPLEDNLAIRVVREFYRARRCGVRAAGRHRPLPFNAPIRNAGSSANMIASAGSSITTATALASPG